MAQANVIEDVGPINRKLRYASNASVTVAGTGNTTLLQMVVKDLVRVMVQVSVTTQNLDAFIIQGRCSPDATATTLYSTAASFTAPDGDPMVKASGDLTTLAAASSGYFIMNVAGLYDITILASAAADSAVVTIRAGGQ